MNNSLKPKNNFLDSTGIVHNKILLSDILNYSTQEHIVGHWINDKPICQKVLRFNPSSKDNVFNHGISGITEILSMSCAMLHRTGGQFVPISMVYPFDTQNEIIKWSCGWQATTTTISVWVGDDLLKQIDTTNYGVIVVLFYTK